MDRYKYLDESEARQLLKYAKSRSTDSAYYRRAWMIVDILLSTGIRVSECRKIKIKHLDIYHGNIIRVHGKGGIWRNVEISQKLKKHIKSFIQWKQKNGESVEPDSYLLINKFKKHNTYQSMLNLFKKLIIEAGLNPRYTCHSTRHTVGFQVYNMTKDIRLTQEVLGHRSLSSTMIYSHVSPEKKTATINALWG